MHSRRGISVLELLVVLGIVAVLVALLLPAVQKAREAASRLHCLNNLKQIGLALHTYHGTHEQFPPGFISQLEDPNWVYPPGDPNAFPPEQGPGWSFFTLLLPFLEQQHLYRSLDLTKAIDDPVNATARKVSLKTYLCPSDTGPAGVNINLTTCGSPPDPANTPVVLTDAMGCSYVGCLGGGKADDPDYGACEYQPFNGVFHRNSRVRIADIFDGTSNTIGVGERNSSFVQGSWVGVVPTQNTVYNQTTPPIPPFDPGLNQPCQNWRPPITAVLAHSRQSTLNDPNGSPASFHSAHPGGCNFLFMDGSCRHVQNGIGLDAMRALCTRNGGETISGDGF
jgi:prepilin-type processing-associated H-X9-DG protein